MDLETRAAVWQDNDLVFSQDDGKPFHPDKVANAFRAIVVKARLPHMTLRGFRHAHASYLLAEGIHPKVVSERLGHSIIGITMDLYSHVMPGMQAEAEDALDRHLNR